MTREIVLTKGKKSVIDAEDYEKVSKWSWYLHSGGYACNKGGVSDGAVYLHRFIMDCPPGKDVDHIDGDKLNNRKSNLRIVSRSQNLMNQRAKRGRYSKYKGVSIDKRINKWRAYITTDGKMKSLGYYDKEEDAAEAYNRAAKEMFGEFAYLNEL